ncbi:MAG: nucleotidyltransferase domain-containing protein [Desulfurococcales archaeon]|nr:nucleotidyltransferase domain-containing protein [Desulfurococcales archaeon]
MSKKYSDRTLKLLKNYKAVAELVKEVIRSLDPGAEVYVFGSTVTGKYTGASDIDILVITEKIERKYEMMARAYKATDAPIELHIVTRKHFERWYRRFIPEDELIKI